MSRSRSYLGITFSILCAALISIGTTIVFVVDRFVGFVFNCFATQPAFALDAGQDLPSGRIHAFADPLVARHEAGQYRLAAARGI